MRATGRILSLRSATVKYNCEMVMQPYREADTAVLTFLEDVVGELGRPDGVQGWPYGNGRCWALVHREMVIGYGVVQPLPGLPGLAELSGGIAIAYQRQGFGRRLLMAMLADLAQQTAVAQLSHAVPALDTPAARFLQKQNFTLEHQEEQLALSLPVTLSPPHLVTASPCHIITASRQTAVRQFPALYSASFGHTPWHQPYTADEVAALYQPTDRLYFLQRGGQPIGFAWVKLGDDAAEIEPIGMIRGEQGQGYGRFLLQSVLQQLQEMGVTAVRLGVWTSNGVARQLYRSVGFQPVAQTYYLARVV